MAFKNSAQFLMLQFRDVKLELIYELYTRSHFLYFDEKL